MCLVSIIINYSKTSTVRKALSFSCLLHQWETSKIVTWINKVHVRCWGTRAPRWEMGYWNRHACMCGKYHCNATIPGTPVRGVTCTECGNSCWPVDTVKPNSDTHLETVRSSMLQHPQEAAAVTTVDRRDTTWKYKGLTKETVVPVVIGTLWVGTSKLGKWIQRIPRRASEISVHKRAFIRHWSKKNTDRGE